MNKFIEMAMDEAHKSDSKFRLGAVLVKKKWVISTGYNNMRKTHSIMKKYSPHSKITKHLHAEVDACIGVSREDMKGATMYVARILKNGRPSMAKPCKICHKFLTHMGIKKVIYTDSAGVLRSMDLGDRG